MALIPGESGRRSSCFQPPPSSVLMAKYFHDQQKRHRTPETAAGCPTSSSHGVVDPQVIFTFPSNDCHHLARTAGNRTTSISKDAEEKDALQELCGKEVYQLGDALAEKIYQQPAGSSGIAEFLDTTQSGYDTSCSEWTTLADEELNDTQLHERLTQIINTILAHFYPSLEQGISRIAVDSHDIPLVHDNGFHYTKPGICIKAAGPSFEVPENAKRSAGLGYTNVATVFDVRFNKRKGTSIEQCKRSAVFLRQMFIQQPNRNFARSLLLTEKEFRLIHYDRSVVYVTPSFDIHKDAPLFVQYILGLSSLNERNLGLDTSVQWTIDAQSGRKASGTVTLDTYDNETNTTTTRAYDLDMNESPFVRPGIHGRGTVGWHAIDPVTRDGVLVKDAWHTDGKISECEYLQAAQGIPGVVELLAFQDKCAETASYLPPGLEYPDYHNRFKLRVATKKYGLPVWYFRSRIELLRALRDALLAHHTLFERGIFHRDVSVFNLLLGLPGAPEGDRGILIDLDMAIRTEGSKSIAPADPYTGTRMYQSVAVLENWSTTPTPPHDYTDDLTSFFYVLCHIIYSFCRPGVLVTKPPDFIQRWGQSDVILAANSKTAYSLKAPVWALIAPYWGNVCLDLVEDFHQLIKGIVLEKNNIQERRDFDAAERLTAYDELARNHQTYFKKIKSSFDKAIDELEKEGPNAEELEAYPRDFVSPHVPPPVPPVDPRQPVAAAALPSPTSKKRPSEDEEDRIPRKRLREVQAITAPHPANAGHQDPRKPSKEETGAILSAATDKTVGDPLPAKPNAD